MKGKIELSSSTIDKGLDLAKEFVADLIKPAIQETGLLMKDSISFWRFKKQVKMLVRAKELCDEYQIDKGKISVKNLYPLLEYSSLEEEEDMLENWSILLTNMIDSNQNIQSHVFPYILSQLSKEEFDELREAIKSKRIRQEKTKDELERFKSSTMGERGRIQSEIVRIKARKTDFKLHHEKQHLSHEISKLEIELRSLDKKVSVLQRKHDEHEYFPNLDMEEFEVANLVRLGLIRHIYKSSGWIDYHSIENRPEEYDIELMDVPVDIQSEEFYVVTELGELFINACLLKVESD